MPKEESKMNNVIKKLEHYSKKFPRNALKEAIREQDEITPILLDSLDKAVANIELLKKEEEGYMLHLYGIYLLAQFREQEAFPKIIDLISLPPEDVEFLLGDTITEGLSSILFSTYDGQFHLLQGVVENPMVDIYVRGAALDTLGKLYSQGKLGKEYFIEYLRELIEAGSNNIDTDLATGIQNVIMDFHIFEMVDDVQNLYDEGRIEIYVHGGYDDFIDFIFSYDRVHFSPRYIKDTIEEMQWWACFKNGQKRKRELSEKDLDKPITKAIPSQRVVKGKKIGRNEPCPCGSGKKYKHCCLGQEDADNKLNRIEAEKIKWLKDYPVGKGTGDEEQIYLSDFYDQESIEIDKLVYLALHRRPTPFWEVRDLSTGEKEKIAYLVEASALFEQKCINEGLSSFQEYDKKHKIHYRSKDWFMALEKLLSDDGWNDNTLKKVQNTIKTFS
jgi:hypothetical protein